MLLGLLNVFLSFLCILERRSRILVNLNQISSLLMHLGVDLFRDTVYVCHELLDIVELFLPLFDHVVHIGSLALHLQLFNVKLLLLQQLLVVAMERSRRVLAEHERLPSLDQIQVLLHLQVDILLLLLELVDALGQALIVRFLLLLLLALRAVRDGNLTIIVDLLFEVIRLRHHFFLLFDHPLAQVIVVQLRANLVLQLHEIAKVVLELGELAFDFDVFTAKRIREQSLIHQRMQQC